MAIGSPQWMYKSGEAYEIDQSLKFEQGRSAYLSRTFVTPTNRKIWTFSFWFKRGNLSGSSERRIFSTATGAGGNTDNINYTTGDAIRFIADFGQLICTQVFRDPSAWYNLIYVYDSTQSTASNRLKLYVNGTQVTSFSTTNYPSLNQEIDFNSAVVHDIGRNLPETTQYYEGYLAELYWVDGQALTPSDFGETGDYGEWKPIEYSGTYGNNGFYLPFKQDYTVEGFSTVTWRGNSVANNYIGGTGFKPDLTWIKARNHTTAHQHNLFDSVRGTHRTLHTNSTEAEEHLTPKLSSFAPDGFTLGTSDAINDSGFNYAAWNWDMGADTPTGFGCVTYKGNGTTGQTISGVGFQPDFLWIKNRTDGDSSFLYDAVRGAKNYLQSDAASAQATTNQMTAFNVDGFTVDEDGGSATNDDGDSFVAWAWNMGGSNASNTSGSINSTVRANTTYGQSIVSYTGNGTAGATVGHGLNSTPEMIIVKNTQNNYNWQVFHTSIGNTGAVFLDLGSAPDTGETTYWNNTSPTNALFSLGTNTKANGNNNPHIAYCFHSVSGYSKFGSYSGNGSATGTSVTTGFRPAFLMIKKNAASNWLMFDNVRSDSIVTDIGENLHADYPRSEAGCASAQIKVDFNATGFQLKGTSADINGNGVTYIYMCFAGGADAVSTVNTTGSIDSRVKANPTYGQSIVSYTTSTANSGLNTLGHGLSSAPEMIIYKVRDTARDWTVYHIGTDSSPKKLELNNSDAKGSGGDFDNTAPTATVFTDWLTTGGKSTIAYCFHSVSGYSKIGSYSGTGSNVSVTTGFAPAFTMVKRADSADSWFIFDNTREPDGVVDLRLEANTTAAEATVTTGLTYTSTGFTVTSTNGAFNASGGTYIYMAFADKREYAYWLDQSGNNNDWTSNNLTESDISVDSPTNNFATMNPLDNSASFTLSEGNLKSAVTGVNDLSPATFGMSSGKWYFEYYLVSGSDDVFGVSQQGKTDWHSDTGTWVLRSGSGSGAFSWNRDTSTNYDFNNVNDFTNADVVSVAVDMDSGKIWFAINGTWNPDASNNTPNPASGTYPRYSNLSGTIVPVVSQSISDGASTWVANFGQDSSFAGNKTAQGNQDSNGIGDFYYTPPSGYLALCTKNLPDVDVVPSEHFNTVLWAGNGSAGHAITGVGFPPDLLWTAERTSTSANHLFDSVRDYKGLYTNLSNAESNQSAMTGPDSDGFTVGVSGGYNESGQTYVGWNWKANGSGSANNDGDNNATVSVNTDAKFSIVSYTGSGGEPKTVAHGLGVSPEMVIIKKRNNAGSWIVWHKDLADNYAFEGLNTNGAAVSGGSPISKYVDAVSSTLVTLGDASENNNSGDTFIMYCWASVDGYSKVGAYTGNDSTDGPFVYTGFRPAWVMTKSIGTGNSWWIIDNKRDTYNEADAGSRADDSSAEMGTYMNKDLLSNGFKIRTANGQSNGSNSGNPGYIYIAFAESPFKYSNAR